MRHFLFYSVVFFCILTGCKDDIAAMKKVKESKNAPSEVVQKFNMLFNESGVAKLNVYSDIAETFITSERITQLKDSLKIDFFDEQGIVQSCLYAKYGEINYETGEMFVKDSVHLHNLADDRHMYTSILFWNQKDSMIYTNEKVKLVSSKGVGYGESFKAHQDFSYYKVTKPTGKYEFND